MSKKPDKINNYDRINRDDMDRFHDYNLYLPNRTIYLGSELFDGDGGESGVDGLMAQRFIKNIKILSYSNKDPIHIILNNPGGDWYHGMAIYDSIVSSKCYVTVEVIGMAMSMGAVILQAANERVISPNSKFMMHYGSMGLEATHSKIFDKWSDENKKVNAEMEKIFMDKILKKHPSFKLKKLKEMLNYDTILTAQEAVELGLADKISGE